jgi:hypothetical protein
VSIIGFVDTIIVSTPSPDYPPIKPSPSRRPPPVPAGGIPTKSPIAEEAVRRIQEFYAIEAEINGKAANVRRAERQARAVPLLAAFKTWAEGERRRLSTKTKLGKALQYSLSRWDALTRYTTDGRLATDNNVAERAIRGVALPGLGRRRSPGRDLLHGHCVSQAQRNRSRGLHGRRDRPHGQGPSDQSARRAPTVELESGASGEPAGAASSVALRQ